MILILASPMLHAADEPRKLHFFSGLFPNLADTLWGGYNLIGWASVPVSTAVIVNTNLDERVATKLGRSPLMGRSVDVGFLQVGNFIAAVPHSIMFLYGYFWGTSEWAAAGAAGLQALGINGGIVFTLKWFSGRPRPQYDPATDSTPRDKEFNFNIAEQSLTSDRYRWPSGHTSSMFAMVSAFYGFYPDKLWIALAGYPAAGLMGFAMMDGSYHWTSDVVAGAIIGTIVGLTVGRNFRRMHAKDKSTNAAARGRSDFDWFLTPRTGSDGAGLALTALF